VSAAGKLYQSKITDEMVLYFRSLLINETNGKLNLRFEEIL
jgi:hypothetical protein